ncbi:MAG: hypothetical protein ACI38A_01310 [Candidatus Ornithomonoglobus sp.]
MKCPHCGEELPEGFVYIPPKHEDEINTQDAKLPEQPSEPVTDSTETIDDIQNPVTEPAYPIAESVITDSLTRFTGTAPVKKQYNYRLIGLIAAVILVIVGVFVGFSVHGTASLKAKMTGTWASAGNIMTTGKLTVTEDTIAYSETFGFMEMNGQTVPYKAVSKDTIEIQGIKHKVSFDSSNSTMTITPGITTNGTEVWYSTSMQSIPEQNDEQYQDNGGSASDDVL